MEVRFAKDYLDRLETELNYNAGFPREVVKSYRKKLQAIRGALDERTLYSLKSLHFEKLKGNRSHQRSMRLNKQWRLILETIHETSDKVIMLVDIEDYH
ncbi:MAG: type II toxin-antitoxin system RelE/ParE family toxin [Isosphaeraceae bacterium]